MFQKFPVRSLTALFVLVGVAYGVAAPASAKPSGIMSDPSTGGPQFIALSADLAITKTDGVMTATPGGSVTYTITASNFGPNAASGATVGDTFPGVLTATWTCVGAGGGTCAAAGSGNINDTVNLPAGGSVTYTASAAISGAATGSLTNTATVIAPGGVTDPNSSNNSASDTDSVNVIAAPVPTMSEWAMILLGLVLVGGAALVVQRRRIPV